MVEEQGRETPFDTSIRSSPFYLPALARNTRSIPSIGFRTRFRATITNVLLHEFLSTQPWEHLAAHPWYSLLASNAKLEKVCGRDWTARLHPTGRSVRASGISLPLHHLSSSSGAMRTDAAGFRWSRLDNAAGGNRKQEEDHSVPFVCGKADAPQREVRD